MFNLPKKFTGINAEATESKAFKELCFSLQNLGLITVKSVYEYKYPNNFYYAEVFDKENEFCIYLNCYVPMIAFGAITDEEEVYFHKPEIADAIKGFNGPYKVLSPETLLINITAQELSELEKSELKMVKYWLPNSVGRVLFSWYFD